MLRRRKRALRGPKPAAGAAPRSTRRRAREGASVPRELSLSNAAQAPAAASPPGSPVPRAPGNIVLVTGFDPFGGESTNPSWEVCRRLPDEIAGLRVERVKVPCEFRRAIEVAAEAIEHAHPSLVVCLGQAGGRARIGVERVAINVDDARIVDNAGAQPVDEPIAANGPPAYFATLPVKAMAAAIRAAGIPAEVSNTAGTFVCNHLMYGVLHYLAARGNPTRAGFIHVPFSEEQAVGKAAVPAMSIETMAKGVAAAIAAAHARRHDIRAAEGALD